MLTAIHLIFLCGKCFVYFPNTAVDWEEKYRFMENDWRKKKKTCELELTGLNLKKKKKKKPSYLLIWSISADQHFCIFYSM